MATEYTVGKLFSNGKTRQVDAISVSNILDRKPSAVAVRSLSIEHDELASTLIRSDQVTTGSTGWQNRNPL